MARTPEDLRPRKNQPLEEELKLPLPKTMYVDQEDAHIIIDTRHIQFQSDTTEWQVFSQMINAPVTTLDIQQLQQPDAIPADPEKIITTLRTKLDPEHTWRYQLIETQASNGEAAFRLLPRVFLIESLTTTEAGVVAHWLKRRFKPSDMPEEDTVVLSACDKLIQEIEGTSIEDVQALRNQAIEKIRGIRLLEPKRQATLLKTNDNDISAIANRIFTGPERILDEQKQGKPVREKERKKNYDQDKPPLSVPDATQKDRLAARKMPVRPSWLTGTSSAKLEATTVYDAYHLPETDKSKAIEILTKIKEKFPTEQIPLHVLLNRAPKIQPYIMKAIANEHITIRNFATADGQTVQGITLTDVILVLCGNLGNTERRNALRTHIQSAIKEQDKKSEK